MNMESAPAKYQPLLLFDGECKLCHGLVQFILRNDDEQRYHLSALQTDFSKDLLEKAGLRTDSPETVVLFADDQYYTHSSAALRIMTLLGGIWKLAGIFWIVPKPLRDWIYRLIAGNRYQWFGKYETCRMPGPEWKERFIGDL